MTEERLHRYFVQEATDYLDQLDELLAERDSPDAARLLRLATGVRGSANMAEAGAIGQLAERLEDAARAISSAGLEWSDPLRLLTRETVAEIRELFSALDSWGPQEDVQAEIAISRWSDALEIGQVPTIVPIDALYFDDAGPHVVAPGITWTGEKPSVVPIDELLLGGEDALREAMSLRPLFVSIARGDAPHRPLPELVDELFDLLDLSSVSGSREA